MKTIALIFVFTIFGLAYANTEEKKELEPSVGEDWHYDLLVGECGDVTQYKLLSHKHVQKEGSVFHHQTDDMEYTGEETVRCIQVDNMWTDGTGGNVAIVGGGVMQHSAKLTFKSKLSRGMEFQAYIYGN